MDKDHEKTVASGPMRSSNKKLFITGILLAVLIWGSSFLIDAVAHLGHLSLSLKQVEYLEQLVRKEYTDFDTAERIGFPEIRNSSFSPKFKTIQWVSEPDSFMDDKGAFATNDRDVFLVKSIQDESYERLMYNGSTFEFEDTVYHIDVFVASPDLEKVLIKTNWTQHWRHSSFAHYWILDVETQKIQQLHPEKLSFAQWSPTSDHIAFVLNNDLYVYDFDTQTTVRASHDGSENIFNGKPDWVYEEEVFEDESALWWSPQGDFVAFLRTDDTLVPLFPITYFVQDDSAYPELRSIKYPKPGYDNPNVRLALYNLTSESTKYVDYSHDIFTEVVWVGNDQLLLKSINRESDFLKVVLINANDLSFDIVRDEETDSWFEITHDTLFIPKSQTRQFDGYIDTISLNGFNHLAYFSPPSNSTPKILTQGEWEVVDAPSAFDYAKDLVYFFSTEVSSIERHLYSLDLHTGTKKALTTDEGWFSASFSSGARYLSLSYRGPDIPSQQMIDLYTGKAQVLEDNEELKTLLKQFKLPKKVYGEVDVGTATVNYVERFPPDFDPKKQYPILFFVYGGPGSQLVAKAFSLSFPEVVAAQMNAVVVTVDGRGTGFKGRQFRSLVRDNLGHYEVIDQISSAKHWSKKEYIDESRIAIFGWSYGGYMTLKTLEADAGETFSYGMSVAPVTDWSLYDSVYTERYMHVPDNNSDGYFQSAVHNVTQLGKAKRFLLCHGTGDDNVHFQNSAKLLDKLDLEGVENYDLHVFPDSDHAIRYHNANSIIYDKLFSWLDRAFKGQYLRYYYTSMTFEGRNVLKKG
jgi:dipeptidyl aminopeptidase